MFGDCFCDVGGQGLHQPVLNKFKGYLKDPKPRSPVKTVLYLRVMGAQSSASFNARSREPFGQPLSLIYNPYQRRFQTYNRLHP